MQRRVVKGSKWRKIEAKVAKPPRHVEEKEREARGEGGEEEKHLKEARRCGEKI